ncbi:annulin-like [Haliotis asinina]|uniref:annulin-like n=1 Tax=Haliotis asinina TaxID=109174 RepID=UPI0035319487
MGFFFRFNNPRNSRCRRGGSGRRGRRSQGGRLCGGFGRLPSYCSPNTRPRPSGCDEGFLLSGLSNFVSGLFPKPRPVVRPPPRPPVEECEIPTEEPDWEQDKQEHVSGQTIPEEPEVKEEELATKLHVTGVDLHYADNAKAHHTDMYACSKGTEGKDAELVLRRGQDFKMTITFDRPYDIKKNDIKLMFNLGDDYKPNKGLNACFKVDETGATKYKPKKWGATVVGQKGNSLTLCVFVPATVPIGEWEFAVQTIVDVKDGKNIIWQYNHTADVIDIIFNPWCKEDWVYMEDDVWRTETVLNDNGTQYYGTYKKVGVAAWAYNQFNYGILDAALHLVRKAFGFQATPAMASPVKVSRKIAQIINSPDDDGVLVGNWSGKYSGGVAPSTWVGSEKILLQYMKTGKPVRYGQCWVFSAVTTAVCRAIGLPCRSVTNFSSAHNTDMSRLSIDIIRRQVGNKTEEVKHDSVWNFHVWNEVYMRRPDLNTDAMKYDGWQVIDATPQERSDGVFVCGPAPVVAVKEGLIDVGDDTCFVYAEVNADKVEWMNSNRLNELVETKRIRNAIGKCISTHQPTGKPYVSSSTGNLMSGDDRMEREDLTKCYKYDEGSAKEKEIYKAAERKFRLMNGDDGDATEDGDKPQAGNLDIEIEEIDDITVGSPFTCKVKVKNTGSKSVRRTCVNLRVLYKTYFDAITGVAAEETVDNVELGAGDCKEFTIDVTREEACKKPEDEFNFEVKADVTCMEDERHNATKDLDFRLRRPDLKLSGPATCSLSDTIKVEASFTNPLSVPLTGCSVSLAGGFEPVGITKETMDIRNIGPGKSWSTTLNLCPKEAPRGATARALCMGFDSKELPDITGKFSLELVEEVTGKSTK